MMYNIIKEYKILADIETDYSKLIMKFNKYRNKGSDNIGK